MLVMLINHSDCDVIIGLALFLHPDYYIRKLPFFPLESEIYEIIGRTCDKHPCTQVISNIQHGRLTRKKSRDQNPRLFVVYRGLYYLVIKGYIGIIMNHYKDAYEPTSISWNVNRANV